MQLFDKDGLRQAVDQGYAIERRLQQVVTGLVRNDQHDEIDFRVLLRELLQTLQRGQAFVAVRADDSKQKVVGNCLIEAMLFR
ncbi:hypothetical protein D3C84_1071820 [compost metagenome]